MDNDVRALCLMAVQCRDLIRTGADIKNAEFKDLEEDLIGCVARLVAKHGWDFEDFFPGEPI